MQKLTSKQKKDFARNLYLNEKGITQKEIAARTEVTEATVCRWIQTQGWAAQRRSLLITRDVQLSMMYDQLDAMNTAINDREPGKQFPNSREADAALKLTSAIKKLETDTGISQKVEVCKTLLVWLRAADPQKAMEFLPLCDAFIKDSIR